MHDANKCPARLQCPCLACDATMCGVEEGRHGIRDPQTHDVLTYHLVGFLWLDMVVLVRTSVLRWQYSLVTVSSEQRPLLYSRPK
jgi:hypothetical protein